MLSLPPHHPTNFRSAVCWQYNLKMVSNYYLTLHLYKSPFKTYSIHGRLTCVHKYIP